MVVAIRAPGQQRPFGLLVESLGDIPEVARVRLLPKDGLDHVPGLREQSTSLLVEHAIEVADPRDPMVMVLNTTRLVAMMRGESLEGVISAAA
jgi:hypothetical protein